MREKERALQDYIQVIKKRNKERKKSECYCGATEDALHLLNHKKCLCRTCYTYKDKVDMAKFSPLCKVCTKRIITLSKKLKITRDKAQELIRMCFEYKLEDRIEKLKNAIAQSKEECSYNMVNGRVIDISNDGIIADYNSIKVEWTFEELEVLKRIKQKRLSKEYEKIRNKNIEREFVGAKKDLFDCLRR
jgi:hypothetical protein